MTVSPEDEAKEFAKFLASLTPEQIAEGNAATRRQAQEEFEAAIRQERAWFRY